IRHAGSLEALLADLDGITKSGVRGAAGLIAKLREHAAQAAVSKRLATIRCDVTLAESVDDLRYEGPNRAALEELRRELECHRLLREIPMLETVAAASAADDAPTCPIALDGREGEEVLRELDAVTACGVVLTTSEGSPMRVVLTGATVAAATDAH